MINNSTIEKQQSAQSKTGKRPSEPPKKTTIKMNLINIMELTEQNQTNINNTNEINKDNIATVDSKPKSCLYRLFNCWSNIWNVFRFTKPQWKYDINQKDFEYQFNKIMNTKYKIKPMIPQQKEKRKVLVLDLDETLIYSTFNKPQKYDFQSQIKIKGKTCKIYTSKRFGLQSFLFQMSKIYELIIFTASQRDYANKIINTIDPKKRISHRLYRQHCIIINQVNYLKNIKILGRNCDDVIIVDDNILGGILQSDNYYFIQSFKGNEKDRQLLRLGDFLKYLSQQSTIMPVQCYRKQFEQMQIRLQEKQEKVLEKARLNQVQDNNFKDQANFWPEDNSKNYTRRKREFYHEKKNSQTQNLTKQLEQETQVETTASELMTRL